MGLLKTVLFLMAIYYMAKFVLRLFAPKIVGFAAKKAEEHLNRQFGSFNSGSGSYGDQEPEIMSKPRKTKVRSSKKVGEYIDFEEID